MRKLLTLLAGLFFFLCCPYAQQEEKNIDKLKVYIDCNTTFCDMSFIRTEVNLVDFMLDRMAADVHVLVTDQNTGSGGRKYQLIFFGQNSFRNLRDTIHFITDPNATDFERRDQLIKYLQLGLGSYIAKTSQANFATISFKKSQTENKKDSLSKPTKDPWNYWVYKVGIEGNLSADENYKDFSTNAEISATRITDKLKFNFEIEGGKNRSQYNDEDSLGNLQKIIIKNDNYNITQSLIGSLGDHWSWGYELAASRSTFSNNRRRLLFRTGFEYSVFNYKEVNTRFFTIGYIVDVRHNRYMDTTLYEKMEETLFGHGLEMKLRINQKWGSVRFGTSYHNYFHDWKFFNLGANTTLDIRITGGLSFYISSSAELTRDQLFIPKGGATLLELLSRRRQLASGYRIYSYFGLNYRFGSKLNNFVNPRFD